MQHQEVATDVTFSVVVTENGVSRIEYSGLTLRAASTLAGSVSVRSERGVEVAVVPEEKKSARDMGRHAYYKACIAAGATRAQAAQRTLNKFFN